MDDVNAPGQIPSDAIPPFPHAAVLVLHRGPGYVLVIDYVQHDGWPRLGLRLWRYLDGAGWVPLKGGFAVSPAEADTFREAVGRGLDTIVQREREKVAAIEARRAAARRGLA